MKPFLSLLLVPALSFAAVSGTVTLLDGTPIAGAVLKVGTDSVITSANGAFVAARTTGIARLTGRAIPVTSHLTVENGRPRLNFAGFDISGRTRTSASSAEAMRSAGTVEAPAARSVESRDTLRLYWKAKRLTVLSVPSDTGTITLRIDTAWKHDGNIPWNPGIAYGSLKDARDGQTYRTVTIGSQTWMAENLFFNVDSAWAYKSNPDNGTNRGRGYAWTIAMDFPDSCVAKTCTTLTQPYHQGTCPVGWHVPDIVEWLTLDDFVTDHANPRTGTILKSTKGWNGNSVLTERDGTDYYGFRALPTDLRRPDGSFPDYGNASYWWTTESGKGSGYASDASMFRLDFGEWSGGGRVTKTAKHYLRCVRN